MKEFKKALKEEYGFKTIEIKPEQAMTFMGWTGEIWLQRRDYTRPGNIFDIIKIMDNEEITFWYEDGDFILSHEGFVDLKIALQKEWGEL